MSWLSDRLGTTGRVKLPTLKNITSTVGDAFRPDKWVGNALDELRRTPGNLKAIAAQFSGAGAKVQEIGNQVQRVGNAIDGAATGFQLGAAAPTGTVQLPGGLALSSTALLAGGGALVLLLLLVVLIARRK